VSIFQLPRLIGASVETVDRRYDHFARDSEDTLRTLLAARSGVFVASGANGRRRISSIGGQSRT
jgi:hypothetical protein